MKDYQVISEPTKDPNQVLEGLGIGLGIITFGLGSYFTVNYAISMTQVVATAAPIAGAIETATVVTSTGAIVYLNLVPAALYSKLIVGIAGVAFAALSGALVYDLINSTFKK